MNVKNFIDNAEKNIAGNEKIGGFGFIKPFHPCVITLMLKNDANTDLLKRELALYWGKAHSEQIPMPKFNSDGFSGSEYAKCLKQEIMTLKTKHSSFENLTELYIFDFVECDAVESDDAFIKHCKIINELTVPHTVIHRILILLHNESETAPDVFSDIVNIHDKIKGYNNIFVLSDNLSNGGIEHDINKRLMAFLPVIAFNTRDTPNFLNTLNGNFNDSLLTVSSNRIEKKTRQIAMASLNGIISSLIGSDERHAASITDSDLKNIFIKNGELNITENFYNEIKKSEDFPTPQVFENLPYSNKKLTDIHSAQGGFIKLAIKANFFEYIDRWIYDNMLKLKRALFDILFTRYSFTDINSNTNQKCICEFLGNYEQRKDISKVVDYQTAVTITKIYFNNSVINFWKKELTNITPNLNAIKNLLTKISGEIQDCMGFEKTDASIVEYYGNLSMDYFSLNGSELRKNLCFASLEDGNVENKILEIIDKHAYIFIKNNEVYKYDLIDEIKNRMSSLTQIDAINFVANKLSSENDADIYFPPAGTKNFFKCQEIMIFPNKEGLYRTLQMRNDPSIGLKPISSGNICIHTSIIKIM